MVINIANKHYYDAGYVEGIMDFVEYLKKKSFLCDPDNGFSFNAIDVDDLDDMIDDFLEGE